MLEDWIFVGMNMDEMVMVMGLCMMCLEMLEHDAIVDFGRDARNVANQRHSERWTSTESHPFDYFSDMFAKRESEGWCEKLLDEHCGPVQQLAA
jgi:hypothetical protein